MKIVIQFNNGHQVAYRAASVLAAVRMAVEEVCKPSGLKISRIYR